MAQKPKKRRVSRRTSLAIRAATAVVILFGALYVASRTFADVPMSNVADVFTSFTIHGEGKFPYTVDSSTVDRIVPVGKGVCILRSGRCDVLNSNGKVLQSVPHTYTMPGLCTANGRVLLYERGGTRYMLLSKTKVLFTGETKTDILTAALSKNGQFALAVTSDNAKSILTVHKTNGKEIFRFKCVSEYVTDISFLNDGLAVTVAGVKDAEPYSRLLTLDLDKTTPRGDFKYEGTTLFHVHGNGKSAVAVSNSMMTVIKNKTEQQPSEPFGSDTLQFFSADESGRATLVLLPYGNEHASRLRGVQTSGKTAYEIECGEKIRAAARSSGYTSVLTDHAVLTYNNSGTKVGTLNLTESVENICLSGNDLYVLFHDRVERYSATGTHKQKAENS